MKAARLRLEPPLTQDQVSGRLAAVGIPLDRVALAKVEGGLRCAFDYEVKGLAEVLKVDVQWLLEIDSAQKHAPKKAGRSKKRRP